MTENKLSEDQGYLQYQGQKYRYTGAQNGRYSFANVVNNNQIYLSIDELAQVYGFKKVTNQVIENQFNAIQMPKNSTKLRL